MLAVSQTAQSASSAHPFQVRAALGALLAACMLGSCLIGGVVRPLLWGMPTPAPAIVAVASTATLVPTPAPSATPLATVTPVAGIMSGNVWLHVGPAETTDRLGIIARRDQPVDILTTRNSWH